MSDQIKYMPKNLSHVDFISEVHSNSMRIHGFAEATLYNVALDLRVKVEVASKFGDLNPDGELAKFLMDISNSITERIAWLNELHDLKYRLSNESFSKIRYKSTIEDLIAMKPSDLVTLGWKK